MKRFIPIILAMCFCLIVISFDEVYADVTWSQARDKANHELGQNFYEDVNISNKGKNDKYLEFEFEGFPGKQFFVYGEEYSATADIGFTPYIVDEQYRALGYTRNNRPFPNPKFPPDYEEGTGANNTRWYTVHELINGSTEVNVSHPTISSCIGAYSLNRGNGHCGQFVPRDILVRENFVGLLKELYRRSEPGAEDYIDLADIAYILQPPTQDSWGLAIFFHVVPGVGSGVLYTTALIEPYSIQAEDLAVVENNVPSSVRPGTNVNVEFLVESSFVSDFSTDYKLELDGVVSVGTINTISDGSVPFDCNFTMPDHDVTLTFTVNPDKEPPEEIIENNTLMLKIYVAETIVMPGDIELDFNILERNVKFNLGITTASLNLPRGYWNGNATGQLNVTNDSGDIYKDFRVENNSPVNEPYATISRNPRIHTLLRRQDFGDNPLTPIYGETNTKQGTVSASGTVQRPYRYYCGSPFCSGHNGTASAGFNFITNRKNVKVKVYNGRQSLTAPAFKNQVDNNVYSSFEKYLWWTSKPIELDVIRLMYYQNENDGLERETPVNGRYKRSFIEQNEGGLNWYVVTHMKDVYKDDREKSKSRNYNINGAEKAVFSSDLSYKSIDYPTRSGYFFNPTGEYKFTIKTVIYKETSDDTPEHTALVDAIIKSFRYESNMVYINPSKQAVTISGQSVSKTGTSYAAAANNNYVTTDVHPFFNVAVDRDYTKDNVEELLHNYTEGGTDTRFKRVLEGYTESETAPSKNDKKYVEFVHNNEKVYKITETTEVAIQINPENTKLYTHVQMKNGDYSIRAYISDVALNPLTYEQLSTLKGITVLDKIDVKVVGSMYDDAR